MADDILYDYRAMDHAYESMKHITDTISGECETLGSDALKLLGTIDGVYSQQYQEKLTKLKNDVLDLNQEMTTRANLLQQEFNAMGQADIKLGDGF